MFEEWLLENPNLIFTIGLTSLMVLIVSITSILIYMYQPGRYLTSKRNTEIIFAISMLLSAVSFAGLVISLDARYKLNKTKASLNQVEPNALSEQHSLLKGEQ
jgi:hypothetical protein